MYVCGDIACMARLCGSRCMQDHLTWHREILSAAAQVDVESLNSVLDSPAETLADEPSVSSPALIQCDSCWEPIHIEHVRFFLCQYENCRAALCCDDCVNTHLSRHGDDEQTHLTCSEVRGFSPGSDGSEAVYPYSGLF